MVEVVNHVLVHLVVHVVEEELAGSHRLAISLCSASNVSTPLNFDGVLHLVVRLLGVHEVVLIFIVVFLPPVFI